LSKTFIHPGLAAEKMGLPRPKKNTRDALTNRDGETIFRMWDVARVQMAEYSKN
jgi:hypothetical protein